jgi:16S rRNA (cytosine967-C5)-methyltransferase
MADHGALARDGVDTGWISAEGGLRLRPDYWPGRGGMDGFYIACLRLAPVVAGH